jgi:riboflavin synthase
MFTGIVEEVGVLSKTVPTPGGRKIHVRARIVLEGLKADDSVSVNGVCLTVTAVAAEGFDADVVDETLKKTTLAAWLPGLKVNLERAMRADGRFGGHFVQGHADGTAKVFSIQRRGESRTCEIEAPQECIRSIVPRGSVALNGVSLTVAETSGNRFKVALIPHTLSHTNLGGLKTGDDVNLETDILGKYVERMVQPSGRRDSKMDARRLEDLGY